MISGFLAAVGVLCFASFFAFAAIVTIGHFAGWFDIRVIEEGEKFERDGN